MRPDAVFSSLRDYIAARPELFEALKQWPEFINHVLDLAQQVDLLNQIRVLSIELQRLTELAANIPATGDAKKDLASLITLLRDEPEATKDYPREWIH